MSFDIEDLSSIIVEWTLEAASRKFEIALSVACREDNPLLSWIKDDSEFSWPSSCLSSVVRVWERIVSEDLVESHCSVYLDRSSELYPSDCVQWARHELYQAICRGLSILEMGYEPILCERIVNPSFNHALYEHVLDKSVSLYNDMIESEKWADQNEVRVPNLHLLTHKFTLLIIENCGFGVPSKWLTVPESNDGAMSLQKAIQVANDNIALTIYAPWLLSLPFAKFREVRAALRQVMSFMQNQVDERRFLVQNSRGADLGRDAFTKLVQANEDEAAKYKLSKQELIGNVYTFLVAGHETTATSLASTIAYLCLHPDIQNELVEEIESVVGNDRDPTMEDYSKLNKVHSAFLEAIRMIPPGFIILRESAEDTVLKVPKPIGQEGYTMLPISKGTLVHNCRYDIGLGYNPRYYEEPEKYKPSRWYHTEKAESELFTSFSVGNRACIGRKFALVEAVVFLTMLLRDWRVEPLLKMGESIEEWKKRVFEVKITLTLGTGATPVKFVKRQLSF